MKLVILTILVATVLCAPNLRKETEMRNPGQTEHFNGEIVPDVEATYKVPKTL